MTQKDLEMLFKQDTGKYVPGTMPGKEFPASAVAKKEEYIKWLEEKVLTLFNV